MDMIVLFMVSFFWNSSKISSMICKHTCLFIRNLSVFCRNHVNVEGATHKQVVDLIKSGGDSLVLTGKLSYSHCWCIKVFGLKLKWCRGNYGQEIICIMNFDRKFLFASICKFYDHSESSTSITCVWYS